MKSVIDGFLDALEVVSLHQQIADKEAEVRHVMRLECGNCDHWMKKSSCPLEKAGQKPSMSHAACNQFQRKDWVTRFACEKRAEAEKLKQRIPVSP